MRWARSLIAAYVELIRNTPQLIQIVFIYFASVVLLIGAEVARANLIEAGRHRQA